MGQHKANASFGTSRFLGMPSSSLDRPSSSSGVPLVDTRFNSSSQMGIGPSSLPQETTRDFSADAEDSLISQATSATSPLEMDYVHYSKASYIYHHGSGSVSESLKSKGGETRPRWLSQLKGWVSASEPPAHAPKQFKGPIKPSTSTGHPKARDALYSPGWGLPLEAATSTGPRPFQEDSAMNEAYQWTHTRTRS
ncbi:hypothetical protein GGR52DRAFT_540203 [Hypoxylon sp. FL1284]|nr:hypothetical protein GGR52DRAFT_540203 [Hypoxylon sp. FL1284]